VISLAKPAVRRNGRHLSLIVRRRKCLGVHQLQSQNNQPVGRSFMFHYRVFGCRGGFSLRWLLQSVAICCNLLQAQSDRRNCCRVFTNCCKLLQNPKICKFGVPMGSPHFLSR
jgi:hypothetical protein